MADSPWPTTRGDAQATGRSQYIGPRTPNVIWRKDMPLGIMHGPVIGYNDDIFFGSREFRGFTGDSKNFFYSFDKSGNNNWVYITDRPNANEAVPTLTNDDSIYIASVGASGGGLFALNSNGALKWNNRIFMYIAYTRYISVAQNHNLYLPWIDTLYVLEPQNRTIIDAISAPFINPTEVIFSFSGDTIYYYSGKMQTGEFQKLNAINLQGDILWSFEISHNYALIECLKMQIFLLAIIIYFSPLFPHTYNLNI